MTKRPWEEMHFKAVCLLMQQYDNWTKILVFWDVLPSWLLNSYQNLRAQQPKQAINGRLDHNEGTTILQTMVTIWQSTQCNLQEDLNFHQHWCKDIKSHNIWMLRHNCYQPWNKTGLKSNKQHCKALTRT